jgi:hypothetical protein
MLVVVIGVIMRVCDVVRWLWQRHGTDDVIELSVGGTCRASFYDLSEGVLVHTKGRDLIEQIVAFLQNLRRSLCVGVVCSPRALIEVGPTFHLGASGVDGGDQLLHLVRAATRARGRRRVHLTGELSKASVAVRAVVFVDWHEKSSMTNDK